MKRNRWIYICCILWSLLLAVTLDNSLIILFMAGIILIEIISLIPGIIALHYLEEEIEISEIEEKNAEITGNIVLRKLYRCFIPEILCDVVITNLLTGEEVRNTYDWVVGIKKECKLPFSFSPKYCGGLEVTIRKIRICDIFGVLAFGKRSGKKGLVTVVPDIFRQEILFQSKDIEESLESDSYIQKKGNFIGELYDVKEYEKGDDIKNIHWKLTGKYDSLMVKRLATEVENSVLILFETGYRNKQEKADGKTRDELASKLINMSWNLIQEGVRHRVGWKDQREENFVLYEIAAENDIYNILLKALAAGYCEDKKSVVEYYEELYGSEYFDYYYKIE